MQAEIDALRERAAANEHDTTAAGGHRTGKTPRTHTTRTESTGESTAAVHGRPLGERIEVGSEGDDPLSGITR